MMKVLNTDSDRTEYDPDRQRLVSSSQQSSIAWSKLLHDDNSYLTALAYGAVDENTLLKVRK